MSSYHTLMHACLACVYLMHVEQNFKRKSLLTNISVQRRNKVGKSKRKCFIYCSFSIVFKKENSLLQQLNKKRARFYYTTTTTVYYYTFYVKYFFKNRFNNSEEGFLTTQKKETRKMYVA